MIKQIDLRERCKKIYENFPKKNLEQSFEDIVLSYKVPEDLFKKLQLRSIDFLIKTLELTYQKEFVWEENFLQINDALISELPSKTPNGILNPRFETSDEFTKIHSAVNEIICNIGMEKNIAMTCSASLRYKSAMNKSIDTRSYSTKKYHSDSWVGHAGDAMILFGLLGDIDNNTVEFNEPLNVQENYFEKAENFEEGNKRYEGMKKIGHVKNGFLYVMDHACLHRTLITEHAKPRLSIDVGVAFISDFSLFNSEKCAKNSLAYYPIDEIMNLGNKTKYFVKESIADNAKETTIKLVRSAS